MPAPRNELKHHLIQGRRVLRGLWLNLGSDIIAEMAGQAGFDWALIDGEHGPFDPGLIRQQLIALAATPTPAVVRVPEGADWIIKQVLDLGAQTILVPMVNSADQARAVVQACRYPPQGRRGMGAAVARASQFGGLGDYTTNANDEICILVQAETKTAMQNLPHILRVDGVDGVFIGPADLGADMGLRDDLAADDLWAEVTRGLRMIRAAGKAAGVIVGTPDMQAKMTDAGANFLGVGADSLVLSQGLRDLAAQQG